MKVVEIVPRERTRLYGMLVAKEAAIRKGGRGTYVRVGPQDQGLDALETPQLPRLGPAQAGCVRGRDRQSPATTPEDERKLLSSFLGFVDRHSGDQVATITIHYR